MSITKMQMTKQEYCKYICQIQEYNNTLLEGIIKCFTNKKVWYKCKECRFLSKHKYDTIRHYIRIHINNGKSKYKK